MNRLLINVCRLGTFGFFVGPEGSGLNGNYALSDMVSALQWVQENIAVCILPCDLVGFDR
jgi:carboxylesterase type B